MKKIIFMMFMAFSAIVTNAQTAIETPKFFDNCYVGIGGQVSTPLDFNGVFPLDGGVSAVLGKELTPVFGVNIEDNVWFSSHTNGSHIGYLPHFDGIDHNVVRGNYLGVNGTVNLMNLLDGYNGSPRNFEIQTITGLGWWHIFTANHSDKVRNELGAKTGVNFLFNLGKEKAHTIYVQPAVLWDLTNPGSNHNTVAFNKTGAQLSIQVGYVYHFKTSNGTRYFKTYDVRAMNDEINALRAENEALKNRKPEVKEVIKEVIVVKDETTKWVVQFDNDSAELTEWNKAILDKIPSNAVVDVVATATNVGTAEYNQKLSEKRAKVVADYLTGHGVNVASAKGKGISEDGRTAKVTLK